MTSREAALSVFGEAPVRDYERVKRFYTRFGHALERTYAQAAGGRVGERGQLDVITRLGGFEFCAGPNSKNSVGDAAQRARGVLVVQVSGPLRPGRISGVEFLRLHQVKDPERVAGECDVAAMNEAKDDPDADVLRLWDE